MRIWLQSASAVGSDPLWSTYEKVLIRHAQTVARSDTTVDVRGVKIMTTGIERSHYIESLNTSQIINNAIQAEKEGYDVFALICMMDPGFFELREVLGIPVTFGLETSCYVSCLFAPKFALLAYNEPMLRRVTETVRRYGLWERLVPSGCFATTLDALANSFENPEPVLQGATEVAKRAADNGVDMLIPTCSCLNMILVANGIREIEGIPVIDTVGTSIKMAETIVDLKKIGVERARRGLYTPLTKQELLAVRKLYRVD